MRVYTGSVWVDAYAAGTTFLAKANNLSDLTNVATARQNLDLEIGVDVQAFDATILKSADIGVTVQGYDADTAKYDATTANFTGTLQNGGSNVVVDTDIGVTVQGYDADTAKLDVAQTFTISQRGTVTTDNDGSLDLNATNNFLCTPTAGFALTFTNITAGQSGNIILVNGSNYAITAAATTKVSDSTLDTISATGTYWLSYYSPDGTNVYVANTTALA
jgi:hypothetical protein